MKKFMAVLVLSVSTAALWAAYPGAQSVIAHMRESFGYPPEVKISMDTPRPSQLPGFQEATLTFQFQNQTQQQNVYLSEDGKHYFIGVIKDLNTNPDKERWSKIRLDNAAAKGNGKAKITVVEFSDFQCPACYNAYKTTTETQLMKDYGDRIRFVFKNFPLHMHPWAEPASVAAECVRAQKPEKFWSMHNAYFDNQKTITPENVKSESIKYAQKTGVDMKRFESCYDKKETLPLVRAHMAEGDAAGINSTPTFVIEGHTFAGANYANLKTIIDEFLNGTHPGQ